MASTVAGMPFTGTRLLYATNGGASWTRIARVGGAATSDGWKVPGKTSASCKVRVTLKLARGASLGTDESDATFTIVRSTALEAAR